MTSAQAYKKITGHFPKFNRTLILKWINALRSGEFKQTVGYLRVDDGFDAIGVLCHLINPNGWTAKHGWPTSVLKFEDSFLLPRNAFRKANVINFLEWKEVNAPVELESSSDLLNVLIELNDKHEWDFNSIADYIESEVKRFVESNSEMELI